MLKFNFFLLTSGLIFFSVALAAEKVTFCKKPPEFVQIHYDFKWPTSSRANLANVLTLQCGEPENIDFLRVKIENYLRLIGLSNVKVQLHPKTFSENLEFLVLSKNNYQKEQTILFELEREDESSDLLPFLKLSGEPVEGELLKANFSYDKEFINNKNLSVVANWFRNGKPIDNANKATYKITDEDVNQEIGFLITIEKNARILAYRKAQFGKNIQYGPRAPTVKNAKIIGSPFIGSELNLEYDFFDFNPTDEEGNTKITWLQNGKAIFGENNLSYLIKRDDVGSIISAKIHPFTISGDEGEASIVSLNSPVKDPFQEATQSLKTSFPQTTESAEKLLSSQNNFLVVPDKKNPYRIGIQQDVYISNKIKIGKFSPRQIASVKTNSFFENSYKVINELENEFFGLDINDANLNKLAKRAGELATVNSNNRYSVILPQQEINNGVVKLDFSANNSAALKKVDKSADENEVSSIKQLWLWGFVAHYLRLFL